MDLVVEEPTPMLGLEDCSHRRALEEIQETTIQCAAEAALEWVLP